MLYAKNHVPPKERPSLNISRWSRSAAQRIIEKLPFTTQGLSVLLVAIIALRVFGFARMDLVVFAIAICALAIIGFTFITVVLGGLILRHRIIHQLEMRQLLSKAPTRAKVEAGYPNETGFTLDTMAWLPLVSVHWEIVSPNAIETRNKLSRDEEHWEEEILPLRRCRTQTITRRFTIRDVLGFCQFSWRFTQEMSLTVLPKRSNLTQLPILRSLSAEDGIPDPSGNPEGDRMETRPYAPGDSVRNIMWSAYAKTRDLNVRLPERSVFHNHRTLAYLISSDQDEAAAAAARVAVEIGALGDDWVLGADGSTESSTQVNSALALIAGSRQSGTEHPMGLGHFLQKHHKQGAGHCVVFAGADFGHLVPQLEASTRAQHYKITLVLATDGISDEQAASLWHKLWYRPTKHAGIVKQTTREQLSRLLTEVGHLVESIIIVDRVTGHCFDRQMRRL
ncbi:MAG: DUF58 domain-containing protein [Pseudohongiellaceae bacterium]|nr:DUF58 domain-containing protein [Pseudohongiellaceae bacterium]